VIPFSIAENWNVISRTIVPVVSQDDVVPGAGSQFGLGATTQSFFFSPKQPTAAGLIWGVGPAFLIPTATDDIATDQWDAGVTGVALRQTGGRRHLGDVSAAVRQLHHAQGHLIHLQHRGDLRFGKPSSGRFPSTP